MARRIAPNSRYHHAPEILRRLLDGDSLSTICRTEGMPNRATVLRWIGGDPAFSEQVMEARQEGFHERAERAVQATKEAKDAQLARLIFDAERWYLGKMSNAFAERPPKIDNQTLVQVNVDAGSDFGRIAGFFDRAAAAIASGANGTHEVVGDGATGADNSAGRLVDMADPGGPRLGQDADGG